MAALLVAGSFISPTAVAADRDQVSLRLAGSLTTLLDGPVPGSRVPLVPVAGGEVLGREMAGYLIQGKETLLQVALAYDLGYNEIELANPGVDPWVPPAGALIRLPFLRIYPVPPSGNSKDPELVINLPEMRLYFRRPDGLVESYPVGVGREGFDTPKAITRVRGKKAYPSWYPPASVRQEDPSWPAVVPPGPENPLGTHAIYLTLESYLIHGTNKPYGVGRRVSHGCIRLYPADIIHLFKEVKPGLLVRIIDQPAKAGWHNNGMLYLEIHPPMTQEGRKQLPRQTVDEVERALKRRRGQIVDMDWKLVDRMVKNADGIPRPVGWPVRQQSEIGTMQGMDRGYSLGR
ncbi:MAG: L,D-transpeptidase family protein [Magnetococcales bacterium]|nr:L,D-transpeptidase family protein [Magnetococcales bacterium]